MKIPITSRSSVDPLGLLALQLRAQPARLQPRPFAKRAELVAVVFLEPLDGLGDGVRQGVEATHFIPAHTVHPNYMLLTFDFPPTLVPAADVRDELLGLSKVHGDFGAAVETALDLLAVFDLAQAPALEP